MNALWCSILRIRQQEYTYFIKKKKELETSLAQAEKEYMRNKNLFDKKVISEEEYDKYYFQYQSQQNEFGFIDTKPVEYMAGRYEYLS